MRRRFDPLFSIKVIHSKYQEEDWETKEIPPVARDFVFEPTPSSALRMKQLGWIFKPRPGACTIFGEKIFAADGTASLRALPATGEGLAFHLRLQNRALLRETKPYARHSQNGIPAPLPAFSGRMRLLYLDNLNPVAQPAGEFSLCPDYIDEDHLASIALAAFTFTKALPGTRELKFTALSPEGVSYSIPLEPKTKTAFVKLPENTYRLEQQPGGEKETIVLSSDMPAGSVLGIIRIFEPPGGWEPVKRYRINFGVV